ncbi:MAG: hypothetical protein ACK5UX_02990 [Burkholderiales bacterium]
MKKTLFVLGAGASFPYGMPLGWELAEDILKLASKSGSLWKQLQALGHHGPSYEELGAEFNASRLHSIDAFLGSRPEFAHRGKIAIATAIRSRETSSTVKRPEAKEDWFGYLWTRLQQQTEPGERSSARNIRFATFNYDRTLEAMLYEAIRATYGGTPKDALDGLSRFEIKHLYGTATPFHPFSHNSSGCAYGAKLTPDSLLDAADQIRVIPEQREDNDPEFAVVRTWFDWAERVWFLGFGFDITNVKRLGFDSVLDVRKRAGVGAPEIFATVLGAGEAELTAAKELMFRYSPQAVMQHVSPGANQNSLAALRHFGI